jgi:hypothetical protein
MTQPLDTTGQSAGAGGQSAAGTEGTATGTGTGTTTGQSAGTEAQGQQPPATVSQAEFDALKRQLQAADQKRNEAEQAAKALRDAQLSEEEKRKRDLEDAQKALEQKDQELYQLKINNAFVTDNTYDWHDPITALKVADLSGVKIEANGTVTGLKEALEATAKANPWMVKPKEPAETETPPTGGATGITGQGAGAGRAGATNRAELEKKFPALRGRVS